MRFGDFAGIMADPAGLVSGKDVRMVDIFISYTSGNREWAFWIVRDPEALGHVPSLD